jgi:hypothetical protein
MDPRTTKKRTKKMPYQPKQFASAIKKALLMVNSIRPGHQSYEVCYAELERVITTKSTQLELAQHISRWIHENDIDWLYKKQF